MGLTDGYIVEEVTVKKTAQPSRVMSASVHIRGFRFYFNFYGRCNVARVDYTFDIKFQEYTSESKDELYFDKIRDIVNAAAENGVMLGKEREGTASVVPQYELDTEIREKTKDLDLDTAKEFYKKLKNKYNDYSIIWRK